MTTRAVVALGIGQSVNWGVLYYAFGVLFLPIQRELDAPPWIVAGAFSIALLTSAIAAPTIGAWSDRGFGLRLIAAGGLAGAGLLVLWALVPGLPALYLVWALLGLCMAATLYEPVFVVVARASGDPVRRVRSLATVTVFGGLASTVFLPATAVLSESWGWRRAVAVLAATLAISTLVSCRIARADIAPAPIGWPSARVERGPLDPRFRTVLGLFSAASLASAAFTTMMVPALVARQLPTTAAAVLGGLLGVMQLPGRALVMRGVLNVGPSRLLVTSLLLQAAGFAALVVARSRLPVGGAVALFALGAGLMTIVRPHLVQTAFSLDRAGYLNGLLARSQQLARAAGPVVSVGLAGILGYGGVFGLLAGAMVTVAVIWHFRVDV